MRHSMIAPRRKYNNKCERLFCGRPLAPGDLELHAEQSLWRRHIHRLSIVAAKLEVDE
jgi:hypothetical protein